MRLNHHRRGNGEPLVLIHGIGSQWQIWTPVIDALARERDIIAIDLPGFGDSLTLRDELPTVPALAAAVARFCREELGVDTAHVGGNSLGGGLALELARTGFARSVCAFSPIGFYSDRELAYSRGVLQTASRSARITEPHVERLMRIPPLRASFIFTFMADPMALPIEAAILATRNLALCTGWDATLEHGIGWRWPGGDAGVPTTVAWGTRDLVLPVSNAPKAERELPGARHVRLKGRGHIPMWEATDECTALLRETSVAPRVGELDEVNGA